MESSRDKKINALKQIQAGRLDVKDLPDIINHEGLRFISLGGLEEWLRNNHPNDIEAVLHDIVLSGGDEKRMADRSLDLMALFCATGPNFFEYLKATSYGHG